MGRFLKRSYFGRYPIVNIIVSNLIFWAIRYRKKQLLRKARKEKRDHIHMEVENDEGQGAKVKELLEQGFEKVNIGGGNKNLKGFFNVDFIEHKTQQPEIQANILDLSFIPDRSLTHIHSNHVVEHLTQEQFEYQLKEYQRILKPGGSISIRCPNVLGVSYGFFFGRTPEKDHEEFVELGYPEDEEFANPRDGWYVKDLWGWYHWMYAFSGHVFNQHLNRFTPTKLRKTVEEHGFEILKMTEPETSNLVLIAKKKEE